MLLEVDTERGLVEEDEDLEGKEVDGEGVRKMGMVVRLEEGEGVREEE